MQLGEGCGDRYNVDFVSDERLVVKIEHKVRTTQEESSSRAH